MTWAKLSGRTRRAVERDSVHGCDERATSPTCEARQGFAADTYRHPTRVSSLVLIGFDVVASVASILIFRWELIRAVPFLAVLFSVLLMKGHYRTRMSRDGGEDASKLIASLATTGFVGLFVVAFAGVIEPLAATVVTASLGLFAVLLMSRIVAFRLLRNMRRAGLLRSRAVVVGTGPLAREIGTEFDHRDDYGVDICGFISIGNVSRTAALPGPVIGDISSLAALVRLTNSDRIIVALRQTDESVVDALRTLAPGTVSVFVMPQMFELGVGSDSLTPERARGYSLVRLGQSAHPVIGLACKRIFDVVVSAIGIVLVSPVLATVAAGVKLSSPGPVLFRQQRVGQSGELFDVLKFRSMRVNDDSDVSWTPESSSSSVTAIGRLIRWSSLDELPQLFNIFRGDMSLVGPRPERPVFVAHFETTVPGYIHRHRLPVGLTGLAQVRGLRGDTPMSERVKADNLYIDQWSFFGDVDILIKTMWSIVRQSSYAEAEIMLDREILAAESTETVFIDLVAEEQREKQRADPGAA